MTQKAALQILAIDHLNHRMEDIADRHYDWSQHTVNDLRACMVAFATQPLRLKLIREIATDLYNGFEQEDDADGAFAVEAMKRLFRDLEPAIGKHSE